MEGLAEGFCWCRNFVVLQASCIMEKPPFCVWVGFVLCLKNPGFLCLFSEGAWDFDYCRFGVQL